MLAITLPNTPGEESEDKPDAILFSLYTHCDCVSCSSLIGISVCLVLVVKPLLHLILEQERLLIR